MSYNPENLAIGKNILVGKDIRLEDLYEATVWAEQASNVRYCASPKFKPRPAEPDESGIAGNWAHQFYIDTLDEEGNHAYSLTDHALHTHLGNLKLPPSFYERIDSNLKFTNIAALTSGLKNYLTIQYITDAAGNRIVTGIQSSKSTPIKNSEIIEALAAFVTEHGFEYSIHFATLDVNSMSFKLVLLNAEGADILEGTAHTGQTSEDLYQYGITVQNSVNGFCPTIIAPLLFRVVCSNGLIHVKGEKSIISQKNLALPKEALRMVLNDVLEWVNSSGASEVLEVLKAMFLNKTQWNVKRVKALMPAVLNRVTADYANAFKKAFWAPFPEGEDDFLLPSYDVVNAWTNQAQNLPPVAQAQIEANVFKILTTIAQAAKQPKQLT